MDWTKKEAKAIPLSLSPFFQRLIRIHVSFVSSVTRSQQREGAWRWDRGCWAVAVLVQELELNLKPIDLVFERNVLREWLQDLLCDVALHVCFVSNSRLSLDTFRFCFH